MNPVLMLRLQSPLLLAQCLSSFNNFSLFSHGFIWKLEKYKKKSEHFCDAIN